MTVDAPTFELADVEIIERKTTYDGFFKMHSLRLKHRLFRGGWSGEIKRELFVRGDAVAAILYDPERDLIGVIEQFRVGALKEPLGPWCLEVVAGMIEPDETTEQVMRRELQEEASVNDCKLEYICNYLSSPGGTDERLHCYIALCDLSEAGGIHGLESENEDIRFLAIPADEVFKNLYQGRFSNAATLICLQWLQINRDRLRSS